MQDLTWLDVEIEKQKEQLIKSMQESFEKVAKENNVQFSSVHIESKEMAQNAPTPVTTYALFRDGAYLTNEILSDKKFLKIIHEKW